MADTTFEEALELLKVSWRNVALASGELLKGTRGIRWDTPESQRELFELRRIKTLAERKYRRGVDNSPKDIYNH